jgi:hypothetical protein
MFLTTEFFMPDGIHLGYRYLPIWKLPQTGLAYGRKQEAWVEVVEEADSDGIAYVRQNAGWTPLPNIIPDAPANGTAYIRQDSDWVQLSAITGVPEAQSNGQIYARSDSDWIDITAAINASVISEAPDDGNAYVRQSEMWVLGVGEAPSNSTLYGRFDGAWQEIVFPVSEAPTDSLVYGRQDSAWVRVTEEADSNGTTYGRINGAWAAVPSEAPSDGTYYMRRNGAWDSAPVINPIGPDLYLRDSSTWIALDSATLTQAIGTPFINGFDSDAPADNSAYGRVNNTWAKVTEEAPLDGAPYVRVNGSWGSVAIPDVTIDEYIDFSVLGEDSATLTSTGGTVFVNVNNASSHILRLPLVSTVADGAKIVVHRNDASTGVLKILTSDSDQLANLANSTETGTNPILLSVNEQRSLSIDFSYTGPAEFVKYDTQWWPASAMLTIDDLP